MEPADLIDHQAEPEVERRAERITVVLATRVTVPPHRRNHLHQVHHCLTRCWPRRGRARLPCPHARQERPLGVPAVNG